MSFDYDLLIIGNSLAGILTAIRASSFKARVALVQTSSSPHAPLWSAILIRVLNGWTDSPFTDLPLQTRYPFSASAYACEVLNSLNDQYSTALLSEQGIEVIEGEGEFCRRRQPAFIVNQRILRSRSYLLAVDCSPFLPNISGLEETGYLTFLDFQDENTFKKLPPNLTIIAQHTLAIELAQYLAQLGKSVTLIIEDNNVFKKLDFEAFKLIQTILKVAGVNLILECSVTQARQINHKKWLQVGNRAIETDEIIVIYPFKPNLAGLNLEAMGIDLKQTQVDSKLRTDHPSIYSFTAESCLYPNTEEIEIVVKNSLFLPIYRLTKSCPTQVIYIKPAFVQIGYTELEAKNHFKRPILVGKMYFKTNLKAQISDENTGFIKLIASSNLVLVGATIVGEETEELVGMLTLAIRQRLTLNSLLKLPFPFLSYSQIIYQSALDALEKDQRKKINSWLKSWFIWRKL